MKNCQILGEYLDNASNDMEGDDQVICENSAISALHSDEQEDKVDDRHSINSYQDNAFSHTQELSYTDVITTRNINIDLSIITISSSDEDDDDEQEDLAYDQFAADLYRCNALSSAAAVEMSSVEVAMSTNGKC